MSGRVVWDIQNRAEGERLYVRYNTAANIVTEVYYIYTFFNLLIYTFFNLLSLPKLYCAFIVY